MARIVAVILVLVAGLTAQSKTAEKTECDPKKDAVARKSGEICGSSGWGGETKCQVIWSRCSAAGRWIETMPTEAEVKLQERKEGERQLEVDKRSAHHRKLWYALRSRILNDAEMAEVEYLDWQLAAPYGYFSFGGAEAEQREHNWRMEFNAALIAQYKIKLAAERTKSCIGTAKEPDIKWIQK